MTTKLPDAPRIVRTAPRAYATDVDPGLAAISVTFDRAMMDQSWSFWPAGREDQMYPEVVGQAAYNRSRRTCSLPVKLASGKVYWVWLNSPIHKYFMTEDYRRAAPRVLLFATRGKRGRATAISEELLTRARQINGRPAEPAEPEPFIEKRLPVPPLPPAPRPVWPPKGRSVRIPVARDAWISKLPGDRVGNPRGQKRLKLKGQQDYVLFDADLSDLKGRIVTGAVWHVHCGSPEFPLKRVTVSTVAAPWGSMTNWRRHRAAGQACFEKAVYPDRDWAFPESCLMDAAFGRGGTIWRFADATSPDDAGWQSVAIDPAVVAANVAALSCGFAAYDDTGSEWRYRRGRFEWTYFPNRLVHSCQDRRFGSYLEIWTSGTDDRPPGPVTGIAVQADGLPPGEAIISWTTPRGNGPAGTLGFTIRFEAGGRRGEVPRYLIPAAGRAGKTVRMCLQDMGFAPGESVKLTIAAVDAAGNVGPAVSKRLKVSAEPRVRLGRAGLRPFAPSRKRPVVGGLKVAVLDLLDKVNPVSGEMIPSHRPGYLGGNHLWSASRKLVRIQAARNEAVCFNLNLSGSTPAEVKLDFPGARGLKARLFSYHYTETRAGPLPDPCLPLEGPVTLPPVEGARNVTVLCEVYVPRGVSPGVKRGRLAIAAGGQTLVLKVELTVWDFTLPNKLSFIPEMNAYFTVTPAGGGMDYYRLAHEHRTCINRLYYSWDGVPDARPPWKGDRFDWRAWDRLFAPLFDGSAFADLPRAGEGVDVFYLHVSENWPVNLLRHWRPTYWAEEAFSDAYRAGLHRAFADMARHFDRKGWHETAFQFFLNSKVYYKSQVGFAGSSAPWIFDEPVDTKDFWALRWYGQVFRQAVAGAGRAKMWYRGDVSYSQHERDLFHGLMDVECFGGVNDQKVRQKRDEQRLVWPAYHTQYGAANHPAEANVQPVTWCLKAWSQGAMGVLPWHTIATGDAWRRAGQTDLFFSHASGIVPSVRVKAFRAGQQLVEYLTLLGSVERRPDFAVAAAARDIVSLAGRVHKTGETDAGTIRFDSADPAALWELRCRAGAMISARGPAYRRVLRPRPTPQADPDRLGELGYASTAPPVESAGPIFEP